MRKKRKLTAADVWAMFAETDRKMQETSLQMKETDRIVKETARIVEETSLQMKENAEQMKANDKELTEKIKAVTEQIGGISNSNGDFAEEFFYNSLKETMNFAGIHFDYITDKFGRKKPMPNKTEKQAQFDIVLVNGNSIALIEAKYKAKKEDVEEMVKKKLQDFWFLYPEYKNYKVYLGIGSLVLKDQVIHEAEKLGIGLMCQRGDAVEYKTDCVKAYEGNHIT